MMLLCPEPYIGHLERNSSFVSIALGLRVVPRNTELEARS